MQLKQLEDGVFVAPQISADDVPAIAAHGIKSIIGNRPDGEGGAAQPTLQAIEEAAEKAGLQFRAIPFTSGQQTLDDVDAFAAALKELPGPVLAYCRSGTRSAQIWAMARAADTAPGDIVARGAAAGVDLRGMSGVLEQLAQRAKDEGNSSS